MTFSILREVKRPFSKKNIVQDLVAGFRSETLPHTKQLGTQQVEDDGGVKDFDENLVSFYLLALPSFISSTLSVSLRILYRLGFIVAEACSLASN